MAFFRWCLNPECRPRASPTAVRINILPLQRRHAQPTHRRHGRVAGTGPPKDVMAASRSDRSGGTTGGHPRRASVQQVFPWRGLAPTSPSRLLKPVVGGRLRGHDVGGWAKAVERSTLEVCSGGTTNTDVMAASRSDRSGGTTGGHPRRASVQQVFPWRGLAPTSPSRPLKPVVGGRLRGHDGGGWAKAVQRSTLEVCSGGTTNTDVMAASRHAIVPEERQAATHGEHPHNRSFRGAAYRQHRHHAF